jgi:very-short-patch-repair endonuclease
VRRTRFRRGLVEGVILGRSREMREVPTRAEAVLWSRLRRRALGGARFRRQVPLRGFIADFCCIEHKLVVELDGDPHAGQETYDAWRTDQLRAAGYRVIGFYNSEVNGNLQGVLSAISEALQTPFP